MCKLDDVGEVEQRALCHFKFFVYREYREIRHLGATGVYEKFSDASTKCRELAKSDKGKEWFAQRYRHICQERDLEAIVQPFKDATGLTLEQVHEALADGQWNAGYGGPKHAAIVAGTMQLRDAIKEGRERGGWDKAVALVESLRHMEHNTQLAILDYKDLPDGPCCIASESS